MISARIDAWFDPGTSPLYHQLPYYLSSMRTSFLLFDIFSCLFLLGACHSNPSSTSKQHSGGDSSRIDSSRSTGLQPGNASLMALDSTQEAPKENYDTLDPAIRSHFSDIQAFLDFIKRPNSDYNVGFDRWIKNFRIENIDSLLNFITADSLEIDDADSNRKGFSKIFTNHAPSTTDEEKGSRLRHNWRDQLALFGTLSAIFTYHIFYRQEGQRPKL